jgi:hypothetical protein
MKSINDAKPGYRTLPIEIIEKFLRSPVEYDYLVCRYCTTQTGFAWRVVCKGQVCVSRGVEYRILNIELKMQKGLTMT